MWKSCEVEICPWHDKRYKRKGSHQAKSSKKKSHKKKSESILNSEPNEKEEQKINAGLPAKVIPSESETNEKLAKNDTKEIRDKSELGLKIASIVNSGHLVSDDPLQGGKCCPGGIKWIPVNCGGAQSEGSDSGE